jgi:hypothetical protein
MPRASFRRAFRVLRILLSRLEDEDMGAIPPAELYAQIPA